MLVVVSFNQQRKYSTCTHGGGHSLQLALVAFFLQPLAQTVLAPWWCHLLQLVMVVFFLPPTGAHTPLELEQLVALCGGGL